MLTLSLYILNESSGGRLRMKPTFIPKSLSPPVYPTQHTNPTLCSSLSSSSLPLPLLLLPQTSASTVYCPATFLALALVPALTALHARSPKAALTASNFSLSVGAAATSVRNVRSRTFAKMAHAALPMYAAVTPAHTTARDSVRPARTATGRSVSMSTMQGLIRNATTARHVITGLLAGTRENASSTRFRLVNSHCPIRRPTVDDCEIKGSSTDVLRTAVPVVNCILYIHNIYYAASTSSCDQLICQKEELIFQQLPTSDCFRIERAHGSTIGRHRVLQSMGHLTESCISTSP